MASELVTRVFFEAKSSSEQVHGRFVLALVAAAVFQIFIYGPHLHTTTQLRGVQVEVEQVRREQTSLEPIHAEIARALAILDEDLDAYLGSQRNQLIADFDAVNLAVNLALGRALGRLHATPDPLGPYPLGPPPSQPPDVAAQIHNSTVQITTVQGESGSELQLAVGPSRPQFQLPPEVERAVRASPESRELPPELIRYVEDDIVARRFEAMNETWAGELRPRAKAALRSALDDIPPESTSEDWTALREQLDAAIAALDQFEFTPPANDRWWRTTGGKGQGFRDLGTSARAVAGQLTTGEQLESLHAALVDAAASHARAAAALTLRLEQAEADFEAQKSLFGSEAGSLLMPIELESMVAFWPLALGGLLGIGAIWTGRRRAELLRCARLMADTEDGRSVVEASLGSLADDARARRDLAAWGLAAAGVAWVFWAARQASVGGREGTYLLAAIGALAILLGVGLRVLDSRRALTRSAALAAPGPTARDPRAGS